MYIHTSYKTDSHKPFVDNINPLTVSSCGNYRLSGNDKLETYRINGRVDYQIIYINSGIAHFHFGNNENKTIVKEGNIVLFCPNEFEKHEYFGIDKTEVYWVHFTGKDVDEILKSNDLNGKEHTYYVGSSLVYEKIFKSLIDEMQRKDEEYEELLALLLKELLIQIKRGKNKKEKVKDSKLDNKMDKAMKFFQDNYNTNINIENYASFNGMSISYFIRSFKRYTSQTPMSYILNLRLSNAQMLLESTNYNITEIAQIIGYDNPLYFARLFHKAKGLSPTEYRKKSKNYLKTSHYL